jgi:hypothetical protein
MEKPDTRYARSGSVFVGYQAFGAGPFDVVAVPGFLSNIEFGWEIESWRNYYGSLASFGGSSSLTSAARAFPTLCPARPRSRSEWTMSVR